MIDTVTIRLNEWQFKILDYNKFSPNCYNLFFPPYARMGSRGYIDSVQNATRKEMLSGIYKPQLTVRKRWQSHQAMIYLYVQFSAPKLLFHNNFDELQDTDLPAVLAELKDKLADMSVIVKTEDLKKATVTKIHYAKNIVLPAFVIPNMVVGEIRKVGMDLRQDLSEKDYRNSGHSIRFHTNDFELIFYDKKKDLQKAKVSEKRAIERDNAIQISLFDLLEPKKPFEVIRIEARLNSTAKMETELKIKKKDMNLLSLFNSSIAMSLLDMQWSAILQSYRIHSCKIDNKEAFLGAFMVHNPKAKLSTALTAYAFIEYIKSIGERRFRGLIEKRYSTKAWYTMKSNIGKYTFISETPKYFDAVTAALQEYKPLRLADYQDQI